MCAPFHMKTYLKLSQLLHQLLLLLGVAQRGDDVEEDLQKVQTLSGHVGQSEDGRDAVGKNTQQRMTGLQTNFFFHSFFEAHRLKFSVDPNVFLFFISCPILACK